MGDGGKRILSIDGGGIRGLIPALVLDHVERETGKAIAELFDVIAGTSTGGILALGLTRPARDGAVLSAEQLAGLYRERGEEIFPRSLLRTARRVVDEKYSAAGLEQALADQLGDARLSQARTGLIVTAYDIVNREPVFFRSADAGQDAYDPLMRRVARATSAAPTYFEPIELPSRDHTDAALVDGGVFANNPGMCAFVDANSAGGEVEGTLMLSLGTGSLIRELPYAEARDWGLVQWAVPILDVVFDGVSDTVDYQLAQILGDRYLRLQIRLEHAKDDLDDASPENLADLEAEARRLIAANRQPLHDLCARLVA